MELSTILLVLQTAAAIQSGEETLSNYLLEMELIINKFTESPSRQDFPQFSHEINY